MTKNIKYIVPVVMLFFFARNLYLAEKRNMDSWMGGGMRMFAEIDKSLNRVVFLEVRTSVGEKKIVNLNKISSIGDEVMSLKILPSVKKSKILRKKILDDKTLRRQIGLDNDSILSLQIIVNRINYSSELKNLNFREIYRDEKNIK